MKTISDIGVQIPQVYLPKAGTDLTKWAVVACDQFTSEPEYWQAVKEVVGDAPSTLNLIFPEVFLKEGDMSDRVQQIQTTMKTYLDEGVLEPHDGIIYVERTVGGKTRKGIMLCLDLERYDYRTGSTGIIRATEGTVLERLPPRIKIRTGAPLEIPHTLVLIDDPEDTVIGPLSAAKAQFKKLYDCDLMQDSGHLTGYAVNAALEDQIVAALRGLAAPEAFAAKYGLGPEAPVLLFAMGDGNHSHATAKTIWETLKPHVGLDHPARYVLVEVENVHDAALEFEAIHRVLFNLKQDVFLALKNAFGANYAYTAVANAETMMQRVDTATGPQQVIGVVGGGQQFGVIEITNPTAHLAVGTLQTFLDGFLKVGGAEKIDYVHGEDVVERLALQPGNVGFYLGCMHKSELFETVILDGALPRKTFSMGEARDKRFYMEARD